MKGKLPVTGFIELESSESDWYLIENKILLELGTAGILTLEDGRKVRIKIRLTRAYSPERTTIVSSSRVGSDLDKPSNDGFTRIFDFFTHGFFNHHWTLFGFIEGENQVPLIIQYFPKIKTTIFTQKKKADKAFGLYQDYMSN